MCHALPVSPAELAAEAAAAVSAGASDIHVHPKDAAGRDTLEADTVAAVLEAIRATVPAHVQIGVTTGAWVERDPRRRAALVRAWTTLPDHASVNWHEDGAEHVAQALLVRGVGIEAGIYSGTDAARRFRASAWPARVVRVLAEVTDSEPDTAIGTAAALLDELEPLGQTRILLHGEDGGAWPVLGYAARLGLDSRIGMEDVLTMPDGTPATGNAELVTAARSIIRECSAQR
jgi:uncharacterized protein (DUF849 family)